MLSTPTGRPRRGAEGFPRRAAAGLVLGAALTAHLAAVAEGPAPVAVARVSLAGYAPSAPKSAVLLARETPGGTWRPVDAGSGAVVEEAVYHDEPMDYATNEPTRDGTAQALLALAQAPGPRLVLRHRWFLSQRGGRPEAPRGRPHGPRVRVPPHESWTREVAACSRDLGLTVAGITPGSRGTPDRTEEETPGLVSSTAIVQGALARELLDPAGLDELVAGCPAS